MIRSRLVALLAAILLAGPALAQTVSGPAVSEPITLAHKTGHMSAIDPFAVVVQARYGADIATPTRGTFPTLSIYLDTLARATSTPGQTAPFALYGFQQPDTASLAANKPAKLSVQPIDVVPDFCAASAVDGSADNTACIQAAIAAAGARGGGHVHLNGAKFRVSNLTIPTGANGVCIVGDGSSESTAGGTALTLTGTAGAAFTIGNVAGGCVRDLYIDASARRSGFVFNENGSQRFTIENVYVDSPYQCARWYWTNNVAMRRVICNQVRATGVALEWAGDSGKRSDILTLEDVVVQGATNPDGSISNGITGLHLIGNVNTAVLRGVRIIKAAYGVLTEADGTGTAPFIIKSDDLDVDYTTNENIRLLAGGEFHFENAYANGAQTAPLVTIGAPVYQVQFANSKFSAAAGNIFDIYGQGVSITGSSFLQWAQTIAGKGAFHLEASARAVTITANFGGTFGPYTSPAAPVVQLEAGTDGVVVMGNVFKGASAFFKGSTRGSMVNSGNIGP